MDAFLLKYLIKARTNGSLIRFTLGLRILLAIAFIPTGTVRLMGRRFTTGVPEEDSPLIIFEVLYQSTPYWQFVGLVQIVAGLLVLFHRTSAVGSILFMAITTNILFITISYDFGLTILVSGGITLAGLWLVFWHWDRIRFLFIKDSGKSAILFEKHILVDRYERLIYVIGLISGLIFFAVLRGLRLPIYFVYASLILSLLCFVLAILLGMRDAFSSK